MQEIVKCGIRFGNLDMTLVFGKEYDLLLEHCHDARVVCFSDNARDGTLSQMEMAAQLWDTFCQLGHDLIWKSFWSSVMMLEWRASSGDSRISEVGGHYKHQIPLPTINNRKYHSNGN